MKVKLREKLDGGQTVGVYTPLPPARQRSRPERQPRIGTGRPPVAVIPFLDALADLLAADVVSRITAPAGSRTPRKSGTDSTRVRSASQGIRDAAGKDS